MSDDDGFVERPRVIGDGRSGQPGALAKKLMETAANGKAIVMDRPGLGALGETLKRRGFQGHIARQPDGTYLAWCERIEAPKP